MIVTATAAGGEGRVSLPVPVVWSEDCLRHEPAWEVWLGVRDPGTEVPARALALRDALSAAGAPVVPAREHDDTVLRAVHFSLDSARADRLCRQWVDAGTGIPLELADCPDRRLARSHR